MRRDKEEIKSEILRRRDEYKAGRIRFRRTVGISAASGLATLAIVFMLVTSPTVQKMMGKKPAAQDAIQDGSSGQMIFTPESVQAADPGDGPAASIGTVPPGAAHHPAETVDGFCGFTFGGLDESILPDGITVHDTETGCDYEVTDEDRMAQIVRIVNTLHEKTGLYGIHGSAGSAELFVIRIAYGDRVLTVKGLDGGFLVNDGETVMVLDKTERAELYSLIAELINEN